MAFFRFALLAVLAVPTLALAQPAKDTESITVTSLKAAPPQVVDRFIESFAAPTYSLGKMSRWDGPICPVAVGLRTAAIQFIIQRLKDSAAKVGAPVNSRANCRANIEIVFTTTPQGLMDHVRKDHRVFLGYASSSAAADRLALVKHDIQAWYVTATKTIHGTTKIDDARNIGVNDDDVAFAMGGTSWGLHTKDGQTSALFNVIIAVNPAKLADHEIGGIADYISFVALSELTSLDRCQSLPSIVNMQVPGCAARASEMTEADLAFLRGLYRMPPGNNLREQKDFIRYQMMSGR
jgi:hypothetical protein